MLGRAVGRIVDASGRRPGVVLAALALVLALTWTFALRVLAHPHTDLRELLPRDSPGLQAFERQLARVGGGATLLVVVESPNKEANHRFIDDLAGRLDVMMSAGDDSAHRLIGFVESNAKDVRGFFEDNKWLYADKSDLGQAYDALDFQIAVRSGLVSDLDEQPGPGAGSGPADPQKPALGLGPFADRWNAVVRQHDDFPSGYFETPDGTMAGLRIVSLTTGMGDSAGEELLSRVRETVRAMDPPSYDKATQVGFAGDIPSAVAEKDSVVSEGLWALVGALLLVGAGVIYFYRSIWSVVIITLPALVGVGSAYAFAYFRFGYVNTTGMFLGAIILGNGINYPIVLLSRYREFRARGQDGPTARRQAVQNALRAELVGACVASIAYGSLTVTHFRGFSQFGWIGFVGMLLVWVSMIPSVPALIVVVERLQPTLPRFLRDGPAGVRPDGSRGPITRWLARTTERAPRLIVTVAVGVTALALVRVPAFLRNPWEYDFDRLGSRGSKKGGAGEWSNKAEKVFGGKMNVAGALMLADNPEQVPAVKARIIANDAADPKGRLIADISTVYDLLPGAPEEQKEKLAVLRRIRERLTPALLDSLSPDERERVEKLRPPERLRVLGPNDLPPLLRRRFEEKSGRVGAVFYVRYKNSVVLSDGYNLLRMAKDTDNVTLPDGTVVSTASRPTIFAEMIRSMERDGPRATLVSFVAVAIVVVIATRNLRGALCVLMSLVMGVTWLIGGAAWLREKLNYVNFITLPITFGIGCEYPFNLYDRSRLLKGDVSSALERVGGAVALCSYTTIVGYGSLLFADFQALQSFGRLAVSGEVACLTGALVVLPAVLHLTSGRTRRKRATEE
jgi:predicted RND superfamily exporter protein